jgi:hypothetical protein
MPIDSKIEEPTRELLGHVIRGEFQESADIVDAIGPERFLQCTSLCLRVCSGRSLGRCCCWVGSS